MLRSVNDCFGACYKFHGGTFRKHVPECRALVCPGGDQSDEGCEEACEPPDAVLESLEVYEKPAPSERKREPDTSGLDQDSETTSERDRADDPTITERGSEED
jgi:hypothetical protein